MAEGFEASFHVPQQSRRNKLRILSNQHPYHLLNDDPFLLSRPMDLSDRFVKPANLLRFICDSTHPQNLYAPQQPSSSSANPNSTHEDGSALLRSRPGHDPCYSTGDSAVLANSARGLSLSPWSRINNQVNDDRKNLPLPLPLPLPLELNLDGYGSALEYDDSGGRCFNEVLIGPLGPFTGYSSVLRGSRFLKPAQQILEELCSAEWGVFAVHGVSESDSSLLEGGGGDANDHCGAGGEKKSRLKSMLDEVCRSYKQYYQQLQSVVASFECVAGLQNAAPYVNLALKLMSKQFRCLKDAIMDQFQLTMKAVRNTRVDVPRFESDERPWPRPRTRTHLGLHGIRHSGFLENQTVWRTQRGLPERAVTILRAWLFEHFLHPYPTDNDKLMLAKETGISRSQVSNWFINARVRLWKPMVEEIHMLESSQQMQDSSLALPQRRDEGNVTQTPNDQFPLSNSLPSTSTLRLHDTLTARTVRELAADDSGRTKASSVTLTLGLHHQNNNGTDAGGCIMAGGYGTQARQFRRDVRNFGG